MVKKFTSFLFSTRFNTTFRLHQKLTKIRWYKNWHDFRFAHHFHIATLALVLGMMITSLLLQSLAPQSVLAANGSWSQTTFTGSGDGTYANTQTINGGASVSLFGETTPAFTNAGGDTWDYRRPVTISNNSGGALTDYQMQLQPFTDSAFVNNTGLVGSWHMNEGSGTTTADMSGNVNTGTFVGTNYWSGSGKFGSSFIGSTDDYINLGNAGNLQLTTGTIEAWVKTSGSGSSYRGIIVKQSAYGLFLMDGNLIAYDWATSSVRNTNINLANDSWHHVAMSFQSGVSNGTKIYIDGSLVLTTMITVNAQTTNLVVGSGGLTTTQAINGQIDEAKVYNRALSATEVGLRYGGGNPKVRGDYGDVRFSNSSGTELPYWQENDGKFWIKYSGSLPTGNTTISMYYGNLSATSSSNPDNTFLFFDDFESGNLSKWTLTGSPGISATYKYSGNYGARVWGDYMANYMRGNFNNSSTVILEYNARFVSGWYYAGIAGGGPRYIGASGTGPNMLVFDNTYWTGSPAPGTTWHRYKIVLTPTQTLYYADGVALAKTTAGASTTNSAVFYTGNPSPIGDAYIDNVMIRGYAATESTHSAPGTEVAVGYATTGTFTTVALPSSSTHQGKVYNWKELTFTHTLNSQTITYDVLNGVTGNSITGYTGKTTSPIDLTGINPIVYPSLKVRANLGGNGTTTPTVSDIGITYDYDVTAPTVPMGLNLGTVTPSSIALSWTASIDTESSAAPSESTMRYDVQRAPDVSGSPGTWAEAGGTCSDSTPGASCVDDTLAPNTKYHFRVRAKDAAGNYSSYSGESAVDASTVSLWHLNEISGVTATDSTANVNTGYARDVQIDNMDATTGWTPTTSNSVSANTSTKLEGIGAINMIKGSTVTSDHYVYKNITVPDLTNRYISVWVYIKDQSILDKTNTVRPGQIYVKSAGSNYFYQYIYPSELDVGWNLFTLDISNPTGTIGIPVATAIEYLRVDLDTQNVTDTFAAGDVIVDDWFITEKKQTAGKFGNALSFDGANDYINVLNNPSIKPTGQLTAEGWAYRDNWVGMSSQRLLSVTETGGYSLSFNGDGLDIMAAVRRNNSYGIVYYEVDNLSAGWHYFAMTYDGRYLKSYIDGVQVSTTDDAGGNYPIQYNANNNLLIGSEATSGSAPGGHYFNGLIDEVRISSVARSGTEILESYNNTLFSATTLVATPTLTAPTTLQATPKPTITGTGATPNTAVRLYEDGTQMASVTADGSGNFTFNSSTPGYTNLSEGEHTNITVRGYGDGGETADSTAVTVFVDTVAPSAPTTRDAAKVTDENGNNIDDAAWNSNNNTDTVYFAWSGATDTAPASNIKRYWVYFGSNSGAVPRTDGQATPDATATAIKSLTSPVSGTDYYLRVQTEDNAGNISSDGAIPTLFVYKYDGDLPTGPTTVTPSPAGWSETNSYDFSWNNWTDTASGISHYLYARKETVSGDTYEDLDPVNRRLDDNTNPVNLDDVGAMYSGTNWIRIYAVDNAGNISSGYGFAPYFYSGTVPGPENIAAVPGFNTENSFTFSFSKPSTVTPKGYYCGVSAPLSIENTTYIDVLSPPATVNMKVGNKTVSDVPLTVNGDNVELGPFAAANAQGQNIFYCATKDDNDNIGWSAPNPTSASFTVQTVAPSVPNNVTVSDSSKRGSNPIWALTVAWNVISNPTTDFYGYEIWRCTANCNDEANFNDKRGTVTTNIFSEAGLDNATEYFYRVKSIDNVGNTSASSDVVSRIPTGNYTEPPTYTSDPIASADAKALSATISWNTDRDSTSKVLYTDGESPACPGTGPGSDELVTDHKVELTGLTPGTTYKYRVQSLDEHRDYSGGDGDACSAVLTFTTLAAPGISDVQVGSVGLDSAIITWKTTSSATSKILYGTTSSYGKQYVDNSGSQVTTHTVQLTGLTDSTTYNFKIQGTDIDGNTLTSDNYVFTTLTFPKVLSLKVEQVKNSSTSTIKVTLETNVQTTAQIEVAGNGGKEVSDYSLKTARSFTISGLADNTNYEVIARARDEYGNEANSMSQGYKTEFDTRPPIIFNTLSEVSTVGFSSDAKGQAVISWETDEPATSQIEYALGVSGDYYDLKTQKDTVLTTSHVVIITGLKPSSSYHFRVVSSDASDNVGYSNDNSVLTEQSASSVFDLIFNSLQGSIGWIFKTFSFGG